MKNIDFVSLRDRMVAEQIVQRGISDRNVISAFRNIPREFFVPDNQKNFAYDDRPLPIGRDQTISQPYMVALMTSVLSIEKNNRVLEIGTGSGYQSAILSYLGAKLYTIECIPELAEAAISRLNYLGFNVHLVRDSSDVHRDVRHSSNEVNVKVGDGTLGWYNYSPYDKIIVTAASKYLPHLLIDQLKVSGKIVAPIGERWRQELIVFEKMNERDFKKTAVCSCVFVPLVGKYGYKK